MDIMRYYPIITQQERDLPFYVATIGITSNEVKVIRDNGIDDYQLLYCAKGEGVVRIHGEEKKISSGMGFFIPPNIRHYYYAVNQPWETHWITFNGSAVEQVLSIGIGVFKITYREHLESLFEGILNLPRDNWWTEKSTVNLYKLLIELKKCIATDTNTSVYDLQLQLKPVIDFMRKNFNKTLELGELAELIGITPAHLCRLFKSAYNTRPFEYITRLRLQKSKELIVSRFDLSIAQISERVGYNSASYFSLLFKKQENVTPAYFRELHNHN